MSKLGATVLALWLMSAVASAQTQTQSLAPLVDPTTVVQSTRDPPPGFPYNTGGNADLPATASVPLRDFLSSRQDQQRAEVIERIDSLSNWLQRIQDERDRQYAQRFASQQEAVQAALASAKEAVDKAERSANDRFDSVNEFRATLADQASNFVNKNTADARFSALEEKVNSVYDRLNAMQAQGQGSADTWGWLIGIVGVLIALVSAMYAISVSFRNREREAR